MNITEISNDFKKQISKISTLVSNNNFGNTSIDGIFIGKYWSTVQEMIEFIEDNYNVKHTVNSNNNIQSSSNSSSNSGINNKTFRKELQRQFPKESKDKTFRDRAKYFYENRGILPWTNKNIFLQWISGLEIEKTNKPIRDFIKSNYRNPYWYDFKNATDAALENNQIADTDYDRAKFCNVYIQKYWLNNIKFTIPDKIKKNFIPWDKI